MFYHFFQIPITLNNRTLIINDAQLSNDIQLSPKTYYDDRVSFTELPNSTWAGSLKLKYYLTGQDYLKQFIYSNENSPISGNIAGMSFNYGYLSNYSLKIEPNSPIFVNAEIQFFEMLSGNFSTSPFLSTTGFILNTADIQINNLNNYTYNPVNVFSDATIEYSCNLKENYNCFDTGVIPTTPNNVFFHDRSLTATITCDNTYITMPLSGENFGLIFNMSNPINTGLYESIGCSGLISSKTFSINPDKPHFSTIKISQHNVGKNGSIYSVNNSAGNITINFTTGSFPLLSSDGTLNYIEKISIGDTAITGYTVNRTASYDQIVAPIPFNIVDDILTISTSYGNYVYPNKIHFTYPPISISGISVMSGIAGQTITISGSNFIRVSDVIFGSNTQSQFQVNNPQTIQATIPYGGTSNQILVNSSPRNISGFSNLFYYQPYVTGVYPLTGQWTDHINIYGSSFTGITGVLFNNIPAYSYSVSNPGYIIAQSPQTGAGFSQGYINIMGSGGVGASIPIYNPAIPIYSFSPTSGTPSSALNINTKIDTGYMYPIGAGYKVNVGGQDTLFYLSGNNSTGCLTGLIPQNSATNYVYIYHPDGISTSVSQSKYSVIGFPNIYYITPTNINQYEDFSLLVVGQNLNNFNGMTNYLTLSGYANNDVINYGNSSFNYALDGSALLVNNLVITGNPGYYDITVTNQSSGFLLKSGLFVNNPTNQALLCSARYKGVGPIPYAGYPASFIFGTGVNVAALTNYTTVNSGNAVIVTPLSVSYINISSISVNPNYALMVSGLNNNGFGINPAGMPSGFLQIKAGSSVVYDSTNNTPNYLNFSGLLLSFIPPLTGVTFLQYSTAIGNGQILPLITQIF